LVFVGLTPSVTSAWSRVVVVTPTSIPRLGEDRNRNEPFQVQSIHGKKPQKYRNE
jgi:hypothetical protein